MVKIIICIIVIVIALLIGYLSKAKCTHCGSRNCRFESSVDTGSKYISIEKEETIECYDKANPSSSTTKTYKRKYTVPGTRYFFDSTYYCNKCGNRFVRSEYRDEENR